MSVVDLAVGGSLPHVSISNNSSEGACAALPGVGSKRVSSESGFSRSVSPNVSMFWSKRDFAVHSRQSRSEGSFHGLGRVTRPMLQLDENGRYPPPKNMVSYEHWVEMTTGIQCIEPIRFDDLKNREFVSFLFVLVLTRVP